MFKIIKRYKKGKALMQAVKELLDKETKQMLINRAEQILRCKDAN